MGAIMRTVDIFGSNFNKLDEDINLGLLGLGQTQPAHGGLSFVECLVPVLRIWRR
jgi:hypothetical protein